MSQLAENPAPPAPAAAPPTTTRPTRARRTPRPRREPPSGQKASVWVYIAVVVAVGLFGVPFLWVLLTSVASQDQLSRGTAGLLDLSDPRWSNFVDAVTRIDFLAYAANSFFLATLTAVLSTASSATVGFAFARLRGRGQKALFTVVVATMLIPSIATLIPTYVLFARLGLVNTYWPWVMWGLAGTPYLIFLFRQFFTAIPIELEDAAIIDGAGWVRMYLQVFLPLARPALLTSLLLSFTWTWGDYLAPALLLNLDTTTLAVATYSGYLDPRGNGIPTLQAAGAVLYLLPVVVVFLFTQRYFMGSAVGSSVKG